MGKIEMEPFLTHLAVDKQLTASTQNHALAALLFMYKEVLQVEPPWAENVTRAKKPVRLPVVLTKHEVKRLFEYILLAYQLHVKLLYGCGLRLMEHVRLRAQDIDFGYSTIHSGKGDKAFAWQFVFPSRSIATDIRAIQELLGYKNIVTTMIYTHVLNQGGRGVISPLEDL